MKGQVPTVLLNQWLDVKQEESGFAKKGMVSTHLFTNGLLLNDYLGNCAANIDEYSVYSDDTVSQAALSIKGSSFKPFSTSSNIKNDNLKPVQEIIKRRSLQVGAQEEATLFNNLKDINDKVSKAKNSNNLKRATTHIYSDAVIQEVSDFSDSDTNSSGKPPSYFLPHNKF